MRPRPRLVPLLALAVASCAARGASAQLPFGLARAPSPAPPAATETAAPAAGGDAEASPDSPRQALASFLHLAHRGRLSEASRHLVAPNRSDEERTELARRLAHVIDRRLRLDLDEISGRPQGDSDDGLPPGVEQVGLIPLAGEERPVRLVRVDSGGATWAFSAATVSRIDDWYAELPDRALLDRLPAWALRSGPAGVAWWQWIAFVPLQLALWFVGHLLGRATCAVLSRVVQRTRREWDDHLLRRVRLPMGFAWMLVLARLALPMLALPLGAEELALQVLLAFATATLFWVAWRSVDVVAGGLARLPAASRNASALSLLRVGTNILKGVVASLGILAVLSGLGLPVGTLLAGLGLGSLAIAFGAQRTVENLFGSIALAIDQPFRVGDFVKVEDFQATVENIGLRSTRFRTLERTLISIPNGLVANMRLETYATRDRLRLALRLRLPHEAPRASIERVVEGWRGVLRSHPRIWSDGVQVALAGIGESSLDVDVACWLDTSDWDEFLGLRQGILLDLLEVAARESVPLAYPTRTLVVPASPAAARTPAG